MNAKNNKKKEIVDDSEFNNFIVEKKKPKVDLFGNGPSIIESNFEEPA